MAATRRTEGAPMLVRSAGAFRPARGRSLSRALRSGRGAALIVVMAVITAVLLIAGALFAFASNNTGCLGDTGAARQDKG